MSVVALRNDGDFMICRECQHVTTWGACRLLRVDPLRCARCGGTLRVFRVEGLEVTLPRDPDPSPSDPGPSAA